MISCAIVILNFNGEEMLKTFLPSVCSHSTFDTWVIDNASEDGSVDFLKKEYPDVKLIQLASNYGFAGGYNRGLDELKGKYEYYILLNSDVEVTPNWDQSLISWMNENSDYSALQPKILSWKERDKFDYAGAGGGFLDEYTYPYCRGRIWGDIEQDSGQYDDFCDVDWASGACMVVRASVFHELNGFDADFFAHMEEIDLCWRMRLEGWKIGYLGKSTVYHLGGATLDRASPKKLYLNIRNSLMMIYKNESESRFKRIFLVKSLLERLASLSYRLTGKREFAEAIVTAYTDFQKEKENIVKTNPSLGGREKVERKGKVKLIYWENKVMGKKTFLDL